MSRQEGRLGENLIDSQTGIQCEINSDRGNLLIRGLWDRTANCIIYVRICDVNQASYLTRKPVSIVKSTENEKKKVFSAIPRVEKVLYIYCCIM